MPDLSPERFPDLPPSALPPDAPAAARVPASPPPSTPPSARYRVGPFEFERAPDGAVRVRVEMPVRTFTPEQLLAADTQSLVFDGEVPRWDWTALVATMADRNADWHAHVLAAGFHQVPPPPGR